MENYVAVLKKYAQFSGRSRRREFWMFALVNWLISAALLGVGAATGSTLVSWVSILYSLAVIVPNLAVAVRRLHDTGRSGWMYLLLLIPFLGAIVLLVFVCQDSQPGPNQYGPNPKEEPIAAMPAV